jgi:hypothetical protein
MVSSSLEHSIHDIAGKAMHINGRRIVRTTPKHARLPIGACVQKSQLGSYSAAGSSYVKLPKMLFAAFEQRYFTTPNKA